MRNNIDLDKRTYYGKYVDTLDVYVVSPKGHLLAFEELPQYIEEYLEWEVVDNEVYAQDNDDERYEIRKDAIINGEI